MSTTRKNDLLALDAGQATISTATVTIRTLRVSNKQLTQAIFRQLPRRNMIDESIPQIIPTIWGWVNYNPGGAEDRGCRQFVAQFGEELCRCPFYVREVSASRGCDEIASRAAYNESLARKEFELRCLAEDEQIRAHEWFVNGSFRDFLAGRSIVFGLTKIHYDSSWNQHLSDYLNPKPHADYVHREGGAFEVVQCPAEEVKRRARDKFTKAMADFRRFDTWGTPETLAEVYWAMAENDREAAAYAARWNDLMDRLATVPQLFIAV